MSPFEPVDIDQLLDEHDRQHSRSTGSRNWEEVADQGADYMASDLGAAVPSADEPSPTEEQSADGMYERAYDAAVRRSTADPDGTLTRNGWQPIETGATAVDEVTQDEPSSAEEPALHTVTTQGHQLAVTTDEEEAVATVETYQRAGYQDLDVVTAAADAPWATPPPATAPDAEDELSPGRLDDENRATDWILNHDGEPAEGARPDPDSEFVWKDGALQYDGPRAELDPNVYPPAAVEEERERLDASEANPDVDRVEGPQSSYFTDEELADVDPNFSYGPDGEPRTRADASSEWVTDPDWDGTDIFAGPDHEPPAEVWEQWEKDGDDHGGEEPTLHGPYASSEQVDVAWSEAMAEHGVTLTSERPAELDDQVAQAREALGQIADDSPSAGRSPAASTSDDDDARER